MRAWKPRILFFHVQHCWLYILKGLFKKASNFYIFFYLFWFLKKGKWIINVPTETAEFYIRISECN